MPLVHSVANRCAGRGQDTENLDLTERAMRGINERDRQVVRWAFDDGLLQREIGERIGVSQMQVSRILKAALARMRDHSRGPRTV